MAGTIPNQDNCDAAPGKIMPVVDFNSCGGKKDCAMVCPFGVFEMQKIRPEDKENLNWKGKIKTFSNSQKAYVIHPEACHACGTCVPACPEKAIKLSKYRA